MTIALQTPPLAASLVITPMQPHLATDVSGIDLRESFTPERSDEIRALLLKYKFLIFRDQILTREQLLALARRFGALQVHPVDQLDRYPNIQPIMAGSDPKRAHERSWCADGSYRPLPPFAMIERAVDIPVRGGDTVYADAGAAYRGLSDEIKERIAGLTAMHSAPYAFAERTKMNDLVVFARLERDFPPVEHPVVLTHPETGEQLLYVNQAHTTHIVGLPAAESAALLHHLFDQFKVPEYQVRIKWRFKSGTQTIGLYDPTALQYFAVEDFDPSYPRYAERIEIARAAPSR
jgi:taurine dioxygenase